MATLQEQARALGDPTRHGIFEYIADASGPVGVAELTDHFGLNHNAIRQHLAKLVTAKLVTEGHATGGGRGRPKLMYQLDPNAESRWGVVGPYERLSVLLAEILRTGDSAFDVGRRSVDKQSASKPADDDPVAVVVDAMARQGFDPEIRNARGNRLDVVLHNCPFESAVLTDPDTICDLHMGIAEGFADLSGGRLVVDELLAHDPRRANCRLRMHLEPERDD
ncbi:MAG: helix-turn-helix domain-containing protein [Acidimicrobiia bacterium]